MFLLIILFAVKTVMLMLIIHYTVLPLNNLLFLVLYLTVIYFMYEKSCSFNFIYYDFVLLLF